MAVTTKDLARICNVSRTTITRALHGTGRINEETKQKILTTAKELGYEPDLMARSLAQGASKTVGAVLCDLQGTYFPSMIEAMEHVGREKGYLLNITLHDNNRKQEENIIRQLAGYRIDGVILNAASQEIQDYEYLKKYHFPIVVIGGAKLGDLPYVGNDEYHAAYDAVNYIVDKGYKKICFVFPGLKNKKPRSFGGHKERLRGAEKAAIERNVLFESIGTTDYVQKVLERVKRSKDKIAFLCSGDIYAGYVMMTMQKYGYDVGKDYGVMGFDHLELMQMFPVRLATLENAPEKVGEKALRMLLDLIEGKNVEKELYIPYKIVDGDTL